MDLIHVKRTNLLILRGIYPKDFAPTDSIYEKTIVNETEKTRTEPLVVYTEIPKRFTSVDTWPKFSNRKCLSCDLMPESYPAFIPHDPERDANGNDVCDVDKREHFCTWNCGARYVEKEYPKDQIWDTLKTMCLFESKFTGKLREKIPSAPSKTLMIQYGGELTPKQFREKINQLNIDYSLSNYQMHSFTHGDIN